MRPICAFCISFFAAFASNLVQFLCSSKVFEMVRTFQFHFFPKHFLFNIKCTNAKRRRFFSNTHLNDKIISGNMWPTFPKIKYFFGNIRNLLLFKNRKAFVINFFRLKDNDKMRSTEGGSNLKFELLRRSCKSASQTH